MTHDAHLAHGLAGDDLPPDWPALREAEVAAILARLPQAGRFRSLDWRSPRPLSAAALATTDTGRFFVKRHHRSVRDEVTLAEEHRFASHLRARGVPTPRILRDAAGASVMGTDAWVYEVHEAARGTDIYRDAWSWSPVRGVRQAREAGAMLARVHVAAEDFRAPQRATHILVARAEILAATDPLATLAAQADERPALAAYLARRDWRDDLGELFAPWHARAHAALSTQPRRWTHGDWHVSNLYWSGDDATATITDVLDFGLCAETFALFDLATAIERNAIEWLEIARGDIAHRDLARAIVDGYRTVRALSNDDLSALADLLPLVHVDFALSEVEYFEGVTHRRDHADVAYHTFMLGHARWFATPPGQALRDALRAPW